MRLKKLEQVLAGKAVPDVSRVMAYRGSCLPRLSRARTHAHFELAATARSRRGLLGMNLSTLCWRTGTVRQSMRSCERCWAFWRS